MYVDRYRSHSMLFMTGPLQERFKSPITCTVSIERTEPDGSLTSMSYMKARVSEKYGPAFQKCILGYMSDLTFIGVASKSLGLRRWGKGPKELAMSVSSFLKYLGCNCRLRDRAVFIGSFHILLQVRTIYRSLATPHPSIYVSAMTLTAQNGSSTL